MSKVVVVGTTSTTVQDFLFKWSHDQKLLPSISPLFTFFLSLLLSYLYVLQRQSVFGDSETVGPAGTVAFWKRLL